MKKTLLWVIVLVLSISMVGTFSFVGCKEEAAPAEEVTEEAAPIEEEAVEEEAVEEVTEEVGLNFEGVKLNVLMMSHPPALEAAKIGCADFEELTGAEIDIVEASYSTLHDLAMSAFVGGTGAYDVISVPYQWTGEFAEPGYIISLDDFIAKDDPDIDDYIPKAVALYGSWDGHVVELPWNGEAMLLFYRTDLLEEAGFGPPVTWDDFDEICEFFKDNPDYPGIYGTSIMGLREQCMTMVTNRYWGLGGELIDESGNASMDNETMVKALNLLAKHANDYSPPGALAAGLPETTAAFLDGTVVMEEQWPLVIGIASEDPDQSKVVGKVGAIVPPGQSPHSGGWGLAIANDCKDKEAAYQLAKYLTNVENDKYFFTEFGKAPTRVSTYADEGLQEKYYFFEELMKSIDAARPRFREPESAELCGMMDQRVSEFLAGELTAEECAKIMNDDAMEILSK